jgi:hypothetical protein
LNTLRFPLSVAGGVPTTELTLLDADKQPLHDTELKVGDIVFLNGRDPNERDNEFAPKEALLFSQGTSQLLDFFWAQYEKVKEFCIGGAAGSGKSCAGQILAADIRRKLPTARVFHFRSWTSSRAKQIIDSVLASATDGVRTFLIVDQLLSESDAQALGALAARLNLWIILIASANLAHFTENRQGSQHAKQHFVFQFSSPGADCTKFAGLLRPDQFEDVTVDFDPATTLLSQISLPADKSLEELCRWTNGHLLSLSLLLKDRSPDKLVDEIACRMGEYFNKHVPFYLAVLKMFKKDADASKDAGASKAKLLGSARPDCWDQRFIGSQGEVLSPLFLQAFERSLALGPPPEKLYTATYADLLNSSPSEIGFAVERECLQDENLLLASTACLQLLGEVLPGDLTPVRIGFRKVEQVVNQAKELFGFGKAWAIHGIPLKWNEKSIDGVQFYFVNSKLFVFGNSITVQTAQVHAKSLAWLRELKDLKTSLVRLCWLRGRRGPLCSALHLQTSRRQR